MDGIRRKYCLSERRACRIVGQPRGTQRYIPTVQADEDALTQAVVALASVYGRYGYRRINSFGVVETMADAMLHRGVPYAPAIHMVPSPIWRINLRHVLPRSQWRKLRTELIAERGLKCEVYGKEEAESKRIFVHEEWEYATDLKPAIARLVGLKLCCWHCHAVEHFGATGAMVASGELGEQSVEDTIAHFCRVNGVERDTFQAHLAQARAEWARLSRLKWKVDWGPFAGRVKAIEAMRRTKTGR